MTEQLPEFIRICETDNTDTIRQIIRYILIEGSRVPGPIANVILNDPTCMLGWFDRDDVDMPISKETAQKWYQSQFSQYHIVGKQGVTDWEGALRPEEPIPEKINWVIVRLYSTIPGEFTGYYLYQRTSTINRASKLQMGGKPIYSRIPGMWGYGR